jgi:hypothetical protein
MRSRVGLLVVGIIFVARVAASAPEAPVAVSPGSTGGVARVESRCPAFSRAEVEAPPRLGATRISDGHPSAGRNLGRGASP